MARVTCDFRVNMNPLKFELISSNGDCTSTKKVVSAIPLTLREFLDIVTTYDYFNIEIRLGDRFLAPGFEMQKNRGDDNWFFTSSTDFEIEYIQDELYNREIKGEIMYRGGYGQACFWFYLDGGNK